MLERDRQKFLSLSEQKKKRTSRMLLAYFPRHKLKGLSHEMHLALLAYMDKTRSQGVFTIFSIYLRFTADNKIFLPVHANVSG